MPFSDQKKLLFIHIPKCGGTSIEKSFPEKRPFIGYGIFKNKALQHLNYSEYKKIYHTRWNTYETFSIVRDPYKRFISDYNFINNIYIRKNISVLSIDDYLDRAEKILNGEEFDKYDDHFYLQTSYIFNNENELMVKNLFKLENIDEIKDFLKKYDLLMLHKNKGKKTNEEVILTNEQKERFYNIYKKDYELLEYKFLNI